MAMKTKGGPGSGHHGHGGRPGQVGGSAPSASLAATVASLPPVKDAGAHFRVLPDDEYERVLTQHLYEGDVDKSHATYISESRAELLQQIHDEHPNIYPQGVPEPGIYIRESALEGERAGWFAFEAAIQNRTYLPQHEYSHAWDMEKGLSGSKGWQAAMHSDGKMVQRKPIEAMNPKIEWAEDFAVAMPAYLNFPDQFSEMFPGRTEFLNTALAIKKQFAAPLGISTLPDVEFDEILAHNPTEGKWSETERFLYYTIRVNGESTLTTSGEVGVYQKRSGGKILQHIFAKEHWDKDRAWEYLEGLAEKAIKLLSLKLRFEEMEPVKLSGLDDADLEEDHTRLHRYYAEWLVGEHREEGDWTFGDLLQKHAFVVAELKKRGKKCEYDDELAKPIRKGLVEMIKEATESFVWDDGEHDTVKIIIKETE